MPSDQSRLGAVLRRHDDRLTTSLARRLGDRQDAGDRLAPIRRGRARRPSRLEPPSSSCPEAVSRATAIARSRPGPALRRLAGREVGDDAPQRKLKAAVDQRRPHPLARLAHRRIGQTDDGEGRQSAVDVDLDPHRPRRDAIEGECLRRCEHGDDAMEANPTRGAGCVTALKIYPHVTRAPTSIGSCRPYRRRR